MAAAVARPAGYFAAFLNTGEPANRWALAHEPRPRTLWSILGLRRTIQPHHESIECERCAEEP